MRIDTLNALGETKNQLYHLLNNLLIVCRQSDTKKTPDLHHNSYCYVGISGPGLNEESFVSDYRDEHGEKAEQCQKIIRIRAPMHNFMTCKMCKMRECDNIRNTADLDGEIIGK